MMNSEINKRLYDFEVSPPAAVWEKLSADLDEINADNKVANKIYYAEASPTSSVWNIIGESLNTPIQKIHSKKGAVINLKRLAIAAIFIGLIISGWLLFRNFSQKTEGLAETQPGIKTTVPPVQQVPSSEKKTGEDEIIPPDANTTTLIKRSVAEKKPVKQTSKSTKLFNEPAFAEQNDKAIVNNETTGSKSFNQPIDDLSMIADGTHYMTMVNSNGRLVKIPANLLYLAPHMQDKPLNEDYYEVMFGEGNYWKETFNVWRKKLASSPVTPGDSFSSFIEMLKTVQASTDDPGEKGR
jgi:hypothetical protein